MRTNANKEFVLNDVVYHCLLTFTRLFTVIDRHVHHCLLDSPVRIAVGV
jgi:hypothetical protein